MVATDATALPGSARDRAAIRAVAVLLCGAALNGFWAQIVSTWYLHGLSSPLLGTSPFDIVAAGVGTWAILRSDDRPLAYFPVPELALAGFLLVPSSAVTWFGIAAFALFRALHASSEQRIGFLFFLGLAGCAVRSTTVIKLVAGPAAFLDVHGVAAILSWLRDDIEIHGNVVGAPAGHNVVVLTVCSTAYVLPRALLGFAALVHLAGGAPRQRMLIAGLAAGLLVIAVNLTRLSVMAWSTEHYWFMHGPIGANIVDATQTLAVVLVAIWAAK